VRPIHDVGLGVAIVPLYALARQMARLPPDALLARVRMDRGLFTYSIVSLGLAALTAFGLVLLGHALTTFVPPSTAALLIVLVGISPPIVSHAFLVFPEVAAIFATCLAIWFSLKPPGRGDARVFLAIALVLGSLPWLHHKYLLYAPGLLVTVIWSRWPFVRSLSTAAAIDAVLLFVLPQAALFAYTWHEWGTLGGALTTEQLPFSLSMLKTGLFGLAIDRQSGLLSYAPIYTIVPACVYVTWNTSRRYAAPVILLYAPAAAFTIGWWAGFSPAARYIAPLTPFFAASIAAALGHRAIRMAAIVLAVPQLAIDLVVWQHPRWLWPLSEGAANPALDALGSLGRGWAALLPALRHDGWTAGSLLPCLLVGAATIALVYASRHGSVGFSRRTTGA
jgi:hypothetical protein